MQTTITENLDLGIPGEFASTNPRHLDLPYVVNTAVTFGTVVATKDKECAPVGTSTFTAKKGIVVSPHQHVTKGTGGNALAPTLDAAVGDEVAICDMGDVYVYLNLAVTASAITGKDTEAEAVAAAKAALDSAIETALAGLTRNLAIYYADADGKIQTSSSSATLLGRLREADDHAFDVVYTTTAAESGGKYGVASPAATAKVLVAITL